MDESWSKSPEATLVEVKLFVPEALGRAFQRCMWLLINEEECTRLEIMEEVIHDFLVKKGC